ncbi:hypothetical protein [Chitinophaga ginsengisegetis]|nr:hypothetical protein [Chitinophaga ginsengisegetis]MDR6566655.1 hypothetical protein [Chitinophaga ginsengisegetis]MDR6646385.1 hypothetical protein [Chitinophaga ginsengisegetis]MDR6652735.1 hypothetical protein [Chitinophaga ginsengisegetis]
MRWKAFPYGILLLHPGCTVAFRSRYAAFGRNRGGEQPGATFRSQPV